MYVQPNTSIRLLRGVPLDSSYINTLYWDSLGAQTSYFASMAYRQLDDYSFVRVADGVAKVGLPASEIYACNYMMFRNTSHLDKWFYAFITKVEYINESTSRVEFQIDSMQTWYFESHAEDCYVEREHSANDIPGDNLIPENLETGEYVCSRVQNSTAFGNVNINADGSMPSGWGIYILSPYDGGGTPSNGSAYGDIYSGLHYTLCTSIQSANEVINRFTENNLQDSIVAIFMAPTNFDEPISGFHARKETYSEKFEMKGIDGYVPKNNKLYTYPYNFLYVTNYRGNYAEYRWEYFKRKADAMVDFEIAGMVSPDAEFTCTPKDYKGVAVNYNETISLNGLPTCSWNTDFYKAWLAQNKSTQSAAWRKVAGSAVVAGAGIALSVATGGLAAPIGIAAAGAAMGAAKSAFDTATDQLAAKERAQAQPNQVSGNANGNIMYSLNNFNFGFFHMHVSSQFAKRIDDYWSVYGYPVQRVKKPVITNRPHWNYIKTSGCQMSGNLPNDDRLVIESIYDNGVTFWKKPAEVGDYSLNNSL